MGALENCCNANFVFAPLAPPLAHRENVNEYYDDGCSGIVVLMFDQDE